MNFLVIGAGGREHALCWKIKQSPLCKTLYCAPGNSGTAEFAENVAINVQDFNALADFAVGKEIDLTVVGPDDPLGSGIVDHFQERGLTIWGPTKETAQIEASKAFAKAVMQEAGIPCAQSETFTDYEKALTYVRTHGAPIVIKASGLALGKGVSVCQSMLEAERALKETMVDKVHGSAGDTVVIEEFLEGPEISIHALCCKEAYHLFPPSQDHKRIGDNDEGPNTGGMGTITPLPFVSAETLAVIEREIVKKLLSYFVRKGTPFSGLLYPGVKLTAKGPKVFEYNARFGDPECQIYMRILESDIVPALLASAKGEGIGAPLSWKTEAAANVVIASHGYPGTYPKGRLIVGVENANADPDVIVFHAGVERKNSTLLTNGGRVLGVSATGKNLHEALEKAYAATEKITFDGMTLRRDIGRKALTQSML